MDHEFQKRVLEDLSVLKTQMYTLLGNGQPGRFQLLEEKVDDNSMWINQQKGKSSISTPLLMAILAIATSVGTAIALKLLHL